jgi:hypothetical protein
MWIILIFLLEWLPRRWWRLDFLNLIGLLAITIVASALIVIGIRLSMTGLLEEIMIIRGPPAAPFPISELQDETQTSQQINVCIKCKNGIPFGTILCPHCGERQAKDEGVRTKDVNSENNVEESK